MDSNGMPYGIGFGSAKLIEGRVPGTKARDVIKADSISICDLRSEDPEEVGVKIKSESRCVGILFVDEWEVAAMIGHSPALPA